MSIDFTLSAQENIELIREEMENEYRMEGGFQVAYKNFQIDAFDKFYRMLHAENENRSIQDSADDREEYLCSFE